MQPCGSNLTFQTSKNIFLILICVITMSGAGIYLQIMTKVEGCYRRM
jgi:hypothetical protein